MNFRAFFLLLSLVATADAQLRVPKAVPTKPAAPRPAPAVPAKPVPAKPVVEVDASALGALKLLPKDMFRRVARIEAREGRPWPERWYVLAFDPAAPQGLREFVFAEGKLLTSRTLSQFADGLTKDDVVGADAIRVNNDTAAGVAAQFALHNGKRLGLVEYELRKVSGVPVWRLTCTEFNGAPMGVIELHAGKGTVVNFEGFGNSPVAVQPLPPPKISVAAAKAKDKAAQKLAASKPVETAKPKTEKAEAPPVRAKDSSGGTNATPEKPPVEKAALEKPAAPKRPTAAASAEDRPMIDKLFSDKAAVGDNSAAPSGDRPAPVEKPAAPIAEKITPKKPEPKKLDPVAAGPGHSEGAAKKPPTAVAPAPRAVPVARTVTPVAEPTPEPGPVKKIGNSVKRLFNGD